MSLRVEEMLHPSGFQAMYEAWFNKLPVKSVRSVELAVLILRSCAYTSYFLPSRSHNIDNIHGLALQEIRTVCNRIADRIAPVCAVLDPKGSLIRVQHLLYAGLGDRFEGRACAFWEALSNAIRASQVIGLHTNGENSHESGINELEKEMRRRTYCNLYVWDR
jgi:hypothetical protein